METRKWGADQVLQGVLRLAVLRYNRRAKRKCHAVSRVCLGRGAAAPRHLSKSLRLP